MTIRFLLPWNGYKAGDVATLDNATEAALIGNYTASANLQGVPVTQPNGTYLPAPANAVPVVPANGYRTVLCGDSMTDLYEFVTNPTASYDPSTGVLQVNLASHRLGTGWPVTIWNRSYQSIKAKRTLIATRINDNAFSVVLPDRPTDIPSGVIGGTTFARFPHRRNQQSWFLWVQMLMGHPFNVVSNGAQSGDTAQDVLNRLAYDVEAYKPDVVFMQIPGINDQSTGNGAIPEPVTWAALNQILDRVVATGARLVAVTMTPVYTGESRATLQNMTRVKNFNNMLRAWANANKNVILVDAYQLIADPASTTGLALAGVLKSVDNIHYNQRGAYLVGKAVKSAISGVFPTNVSSVPRVLTDSFAGSSIAVTNAGTSSTAGTATVRVTGHGVRVGEVVGITGATGATTGLNGWWPVTSVIDANNFTVFTGGVDFAASTGAPTMSRNRNLFPNPVLNNAASGGSIVGTNVTGASAQYINTTSISGSPTAVASVVPAWTGNGNAQRFVMSLASVDQTMGFQNTSITGLFVNQMAAGRTYQFEALMQLSSAAWASTPVSETYCEFIIQMDSSYTVSIRASEVYESGVDTAGENYTVHFKTPQFTPPAGTITQAYFQIWVRAGGAVSANLTVDLTGIALWEIAP